MNILYIRILRQVGHLPEGSKFCQHHTDFGTLLVSKMNFSVVLTLWPWNWTFKE